MYGITRSTQVLEMARAVCDVLGHGKNDKAVHLLVETAAQETWLGTFRDRHNHAMGVGLCQFDPIAFDDVKQRTSAAVVETVRRELGIDIKAIELRELAHSPLLSLLFCRLKYRLIPAPIPATLEGRAQYWKDHYNSALGKGTPEEYVRSARRHAKTLLEG